MRNLWKQLAKNDSGFTLTEVLIGIMVMTVAIVSGTNLLVDLMNSNRNAVSNLQAYYFAQEGIESVRNIRDTNWLHNRDWLGGSSEALWGTELNPGNDYAVDVLGHAWAVAPDSKTRSFTTLNAFAPWQLSQVTGAFDAGKIYKREDVSDVYFSSLVSFEGDTGFSRIVSILPYEDCDSVNCEQVLVRSRVMWEQQSKDREVVLEAVLTDWKGGAF